MLAVLALHLRTAVLYIYILCDREHVCVLAGCLLAMCEVCRLVLIRLLTVRPRILNQDEIS